LTAEEERNDQDDPRADVPEGPEAVQPEADPAAPGHGAEDAAGGDSEPAGEAEPAEELSPKDRRKRERQRAAEARPQRTPEERAEERWQARAARAAARRRVRASVRRRREPGEGTPPRERRPGVRKVRQGVVKSAKPDKTITVQIEITRRHPTYEKVVRRTSTIHAHDERNQAQEGDIVRVVESRPLSRTKRWRLVEVLERAR
jgi:small subunit ribosomal protein S17